MLLTAGCSFVWGDELDGFDNNPPTHWPLTWTHLAAEKMGIPYVNRGVCGACNDKIFREVTDYLWSNQNNLPTHIAVMWSAWQRTELVEYVRDEVEIQIQRQQNVTQFSPLRLDLIQDRATRHILASWFEDAYNTRTDMLHTFTKMKTLEVICDAMGIKLIQGTFHSRCKSNLMATLTDFTPDGKKLSVEQKIDSVPEYKEWLTTALSNLRDTSKVGFTFGKDLYTICRELDDMKPYGHPGERTQVVFADFIFETFMKMEQGVL